MKRGEKLRTAAIGLIADVQFTADAADWPGERYYSDALNKARAAAAAWARSAPEPLRLAFNLGDIVDRRCAGPTAAAAAWDAVIGSFDAGFTEALGDKAERPRLLHLHGNHDLSALGFDVVAAKLSACAGHPGLQDQFVPPPPAADGRPATYFAVLEPATGVVIACVDTYELSAKGHASIREDAVALHAALRRKKVQGTKDHVELNGATSKAQVAWLHEVLAAAAAERRSVVVLSHAPFVPQVTHYGDAVCWNGGELRRLFNTMLHEGSGEPVVAAVISGHDHFGGRWDDPDSGIPHIVLEAAVVGPPNAPAHARLVLGVDPAGDAALVRSMRLEGAGSVTSHVLR